jgi:hypothetical protein
VDTGLRLGCLDGFMPVKEGRNAGERRAIGQAMVLLPVGMVKLRPIGRWDGLMSRRSLFVLVVSLLLFLSACAASKDASGRAVEELLQALVKRDEARYSALTCPSYEQSALVEYDSFGLVTADLKGVSCKQTGVDGGTALVHCTGSIEATYGNEVQSFDLSLRTYHVSLLGGDWLVCGYSK